MPSGAKKRKAAKRKEQEQQQKLDAHTPVSTTSPTTSHLHPPHGNGARDDDDLLSDSNNGSRSGSDFASSAPGDKHNHRLEVEEEEHAESCVESKGEEKDKLESGSGTVEVLKLMDYIENGGGEQPSDLLATKKTEEDMTKNSEDVAVAVAVETKAGIPPLPPLDPFNRTSSEVPISETQTVNVEYVQSEKGNNVDISREEPCPLEHEQLEAGDTASPLEQCIPIPEEVIQATDIPAESLEVLESVAQAPSSKIVEKVVAQTGSTSEQPDNVVEGHPSIESHEDAGTTKVAQSTQLGQRASWMSCCGLFDVITGSNG